MSSRKLQPSWVVLAAVTVAVMEHHDQEQLCEEFIGLDFHITVYHLRKSGREPGGGVLLRGSLHPGPVAQGGPTHSGLGPHPSITN